MFFLSAFLGRLEGPPAQSCTELDELVPQQLDAQLRQHLQAELLRKLPPRPGADGSCLQQLGAEVECHVGVDPCSRSVYKFC